jgi:hypothetical protein
MNNTWIITNMSKMNKLVQTKLNQTESNFFTNRYRLYKNNGICSCCNNKQETVKYLLCFLSSSKEFFM